MSRFYHPENTKNYRTNRIWGPDGKLLIKCPKNNDEIIMRRMWNDHGDLLEKSQTKNGKKHGLDKWRGAVQSKGYYINDKPNGEDIAIWFDTALIISYHTHNNIYTNLRKFQEGSKTKFIKLKPWFSLKCFVRYSQKKYRKRSLKKLFNKLNFTCYDVFLIITGYLDNDSIRELLKF